MSHSKVALYYRTNQKNPGQTLGNIPKRIACSCEKFLR